MSIRKIAYLGDSLSDSDSFWTLSQQVLKVPLPNQTWYAGQFSNGAVHSDIVPGLLRLQGGEALNYAFAGGRAVGSLKARHFIDDPSILKVEIDDPRLDIDINLGAQTDRLLADAAAGNLVLSETAVSIWIGANDLSNWQPVSSLPWRWSGEIDALVRDIAASVRENVVELLAQGTGEVWVSSLPETTFFPVFNEAGFLTEYLSEGVIEDLNGRLERMVRDLSGDGAPVRILDMHAIAVTLEDDAGAFGITEMEKPILTGSNTDYHQRINPDLGRGFSFERDADRIGFVDPVHPSAALHGVLAAFEAEAMSNDLMVFGDRDSRIEAGIGGQIILAGGGNDSVDAGAGQDVILGSEGHDQLFGGGGSDILSGGAGRDELHGGSYHDLLAGGYGRDRLFGGTGEDVLVAGVGDDHLWAGAGADWLLWIDPRLAGRRPDAGIDLLGGGSGGDHAVFYLADSATFDAVVAEYAAEGGRNFVLDTIGVEGRSIEAVRFVDLSADGMLLPETGNSALDTRLTEADLWGFV